MKISVIQTHPVRGDVQKNLESHLEWIRRSTDLGADLVLFPELSLTGYEPTLAGEVAFTPGDPVFRILQATSDTQKIAIAAGGPVQSASGITISTLLFRPTLPEIIYSKQYLHADEDPYFIPGVFTPPVEICGIASALAICFEISVAEHPEKAVGSGARLYLASVAKTREGVSRAMDQLAAIAGKYSIPVCMSNCVGPADDFMAGGGSAVWSPNGRLLDQLEAEKEGMLICDLAEDQTISGPIFA